jgi:hypothetical protein
MPRRELKRIEMPLGGPGPEETEAADARAGKLAQQKEKPLAAQDDAHKSDEEAVEARSKARLADEKYQR